MEPSVKHYIRPSKVQTFLKTKRSLALLNITMRLTVKLSVIDVPVFLSFFYLNKILRLQLYRTNLIMISLGVLLFCFGFPTL